MRGGSGGEAGRAVAENRGLGKGTGRDSPAITDPEYCGSGMDSGRGVPNSVMPDGKFFDSGPAGLAGTAKGLVGAPGSVGRESFSTAIGAVIVVAAAGAAACVAAGIVVEAGLAGLVGGTGAATCVG